MPKAVYLVTSQASAPERDAEFNDWYTNVHLPDVCAVDGVMGASRYQLLGSESPKYLAIYEIDHESPESVVAAIAAAAMEGRMRMSDSMSMKPPPDTRLFVQA